MGVGYKRKHCLGENLEKIIEGGLGGCREVALGESSLG